MKKEKNDKLSYLLVGLGTAVFFVCGMPIIDSISNWLQNSFNIKSIKLQGEAEEMQNSPENSVSAIGFDPNRGNDINLEESELEEE